MIAPPEIVSSPAQAVARVHLSIPRAEIRTVMGPTISEVYAAVVAQGKTPAGPWLTYHHKMTPDRFDFDACVPIAGAITPFGRVTAGEVPGASRVARTIYRGPYEGLAAAWGELRAWIAAQGHTPRPDLWERYLVGPESATDPATWQTELDQPLA